MPIGYGFTSAGDEHDETGRRMFEQSGGALADSIEFADADGVRWTVRESAPSDVAAHAGQTSLIFESAVAVRRVWRYPEDWRAMSAEQLSALSWRT